MSGEPPDFWAMRDAWADACAQYPSALSDYWASPYIENVADGMFVPVWSHFTDRLNTFVHRRRPPLPGEADLWGQLPAFWSFDRNLEFGGW